MTDHERARHPGRYRGRQLKIYGGGSLLAIGAAFGIFWFVSGQQILPPKTWAGPHDETWPDERISTTPISIPEQKHILEHDPNERPGVLLEYSCDKFDCASDLDNKLAEIAEPYPHVYVAPYPEMDVKIAVVAEGAMLTLDEFDRQKIVAFIDAH